MSLLPEYKDTRTVNPYKTFGPPENPGMSWHDYFKSIPRQWRIEEENPEPPEDPRSVRVRMRDATEDELSTCKPIRDIEALASAHGWETKLGYSQSFIKGQMVKSGKTAGQMNPDVIVEHLRMSARKQGRGVCGVTYERRNGGKWTRYLATQNQIMHHMGATEFKEWLTS